MATQAWAWAADNPNPNKRARLLQQPVMEAINTRTISDIKTRKLIAITKETMEESLNALNMAAKLLARRLNAMWNVLLTAEEAAKALAGNIKSLRLQNEYMGTRKTRIILHEVPMYITGGLLFELWACGILCQKHSGYCDQRLCGNVNADREEICQTY